jgi:hypothetical protein
MPVVCPKCYERCHSFVPGEGICADCFWDEDSERKAKLRYDPNWVFQRAYSAAITLLGKTHEQAITIAKLTVEQRFGKQK